jgi:hypothetical protein
MTASEEGSVTTGPTVSLVEGNISIDFSGHYGRPIEDYNHFSMSRKRNFSAMAERCAGGLAALLENPDFAWGLLSLRYDISLPEDDPDFVTEEALAQRVADLIDERSVATIGAIVDHAYAAEDVDIDTDHGGKANEELQFTNDHALIILRWTFACMSCAPVITAFMDERDIQARNSMNVIMGVFTALLRRFEPADGSTDILAKIRKLVESRVLQTRYSDKVIWNYLRNVATDPHIFIDQLFRKFIAEGIPKLEQGTNVIKFFHTFLRNQIKFQFTAKFPISYRPVRQDVMDPEGVGAMEHLENELVRRDESAVVIGELVCSQALMQTYRDVEYEPSEEEILHWSDMVREHGINEWQRGMVTKFFLPRIGRVEHILTRSLSDYVRMFLVTRRWLVRNDLPALAAYMSARVTDGQDARKLMARKKFIREFIDSDAYRALLGGCFSTTSQSVIDSGVIIEMISAVHVGNFALLPEYGEAVEEGPRPTVTHRVETIAQEVLRFIAHIARP